MHYPDGENSDFESAPVNPAGDHFMSATSRAGQSNSDSSKSFQSLFELAANRLGMGTQVKAIRICHQARQTLSELLPGHISSIHVVSCKNSQLALRADTASLRQKLFTKRHLLQQSLNNHFGPGTISRITIR